MKIDLKHTSYSLKNKIIGNNEYVKENFDFVIDTSTTVKLKFTAGGKDNTVNLGDIFINNNNKSIARVIVIDETLYDPIQIEYECGTKEFFSKELFYKQFELILKVAQ